MTVQRHGNGWRGRYRGADGRVHATPTYGTAEKAKIALEAARTDVRRRDWTAPARASLTLTRFWDDWSATAEWRAKTRHANEGRWRLHIKPYLGTHRVGEIEQDDIRRWLQRLERDGRTPTTRAKALELLKTMLGPKGAIGEGRRRHNPCDGVTVKVLRRVKPVWRILSESESDRLFDVHDPAWLVVPLLALHGGLRWSEIPPLTVADYRPGERLLHVEKDAPEVSGKHVIGMAKSGRDRWVPVSKRLAYELDRWAEGKNPGDLLVPAQRGGMLRHTHYREHHWLPALVAAGLGKVRFHDLRHTCATRLLAAGVDIATVKEIMGHYSVTVTELYLHADDDRKLSAVDSAF